MAKPLEIAGIAAAVAVGLGFLWLTARDHDAPVDALGPRGEEAASPSAPISPARGDTAGPSVATPPETNARTPLGSPPSIPVRPGHVVRIGDRMPVADVEIHLRRRDARGQPDPADPDAALARSDEAGFFEVIGDIGLEHHLVFRREGYGIRVVSPAEIPPSPSTPFVVELASLGEIEVFVVDTEESPVVGVTVSGYASSGGVGDRGFATHFDHRETTGEDGVARFTRAPCGVPLRVRLGRRGFPALDVARETLVIDPAVGRATVRLVQPTPGRVTGHVIDTEGQPVSAAVSLEADGSFFRHDTETKEEGRFHFSRVSPGAARVVVAIPGVDPVPVEVPSGEELVVAPIVVPAAATLVVQLRSRFEFEARDLSLVLHRHGEPLGRPLDLDEDGKATVHVPSGPVLVTVVRHEFNPWRTQGGPLESSRLTEWRTIARARVAELPAEIEVSLDAGVGVLEGEGAGTDPADVLPKGKRPRPASTCLLTPPGSRWSGQASVAAARSAAQRAGTRSAIRLAG